MDLTRREFVKLLGSLMGGWAITLPEGSDLGKISQILNTMSSHTDPAVEDDPAESYPLNPSPATDPEKAFIYREREAARISKDLRELDKIGRFNEIKSRYYVFDENKYLYYSSVSENLIFGAPDKDEFSDTNLSRNEYFLNFLNTADLTRPLKSGTSRAPNT